MVGKIGNRKKDSLEEMGSVDMIKISGGTWFPRAAYLQYGSPNKDGGKVMEERHHYGSKS